MYRGARAPDDRAPVVAALPPAAGTVGVELRGARLPLSAARVPDPVVTACASLTVRDPAHRIGADRGTATSR